MSSPSMPMTKCPVCGVSVKDENLVRHVKNQHPHEKVDGLEKMAPAPKRPSREWRDDLARIGTILTVAGIVWLALAFVFPTPVGVMVPVFPGLLGFTVFGVILLAFGWVMGSGALQRSGRRLAVVGLVVGLVLAGSSALLATQQGVPILSTQTTSLGQTGWIKAPNSVWRINNLPVLFYYGSAGCPYCAASSWALMLALQAFGSMSGQTYTTSSPTDTPASIPEVELAHITYSSGYLSLDLLAGDNNQVISAPSPNPVQNAYLLTYDNQGGAYSFPFYAVGGLYFHAGAIVVPSVYITSSGTMTPTDVQNAIASQSGTVYAAIHNAAVLLEAAMVRACQAAGVNPPPSVTSDAAVQGALAVIT